MPDHDSHIAISESSARTASRVGYYSAILTTVITIITFGLALTAIPIAGANCPGECISYPYQDTIGQFPRDYLWMIPAMVLVLSYVVLMVSIHFYTADQKKIFSQIGLSFALITAVILLVDYFLQFSVVPVSLKHAETEGIALLTQYNAHGIFIALEDLGYLMMSLSFLFMAPSFAHKGRLESVIRWIFILSFILAIASLLIISFTYGIDRQDRLEVAILSINWLVLIINGALLSIVFRRQLNA